MRRDLILLCACLASLATGASAQTTTPNCSQLFTGDACQKSVDLFLFVAPQLGTVIAGGSPVLGQGSVLTFLGSDRPFPGVSAGLRVNILAASIPDLTNVPFSVTGPSNGTAIPVRNQLVVGPTLDAAIGVFRGIAVPTIDILAVDILLSALYLPDIDADGVHVRTSGSALRLGWGARVGVLQETVLTPSLTASFLRRRLPTVDVTALSQGSNNVDIDISGLRMTTDSWRAIVSKSFVGFAIALGGGTDTYDSGAIVAATVNNLTAGPFAIAQSVTRTNLFADLTVKLGVLRLSGELGRVQGGNIETYNVFAGTSADAARTYGSLGARVTF